MSKLLDQVNKSVEKGTVADQTETKPSFEREVVPEGRYPARFIGYVEVGDRDGGEWKGKAKPPVRKAFAEFELMSKKLAREIEIEGEGKKVVYPTIRARLDVKTGEKANLTKLFKQMAAGRPLTHIAQMLEEPFLVKVSHYVKNKGTPEEVTYENLKDDSGWLVFPPEVTQVDEETGDTTTKKLNVLPQTLSTRLLLWDDPTPEQWDSIKMNPFKYKKGNEEFEFEGGYYQYICTHDALDYEGSPLHAMLGGEALGDLGESVLDDEDDLNGDHIPDHDEPEKSEAATSDGDEDLGLGDLDDIE